MVISLEISHENEVRLTDEARLPDALNLAVQQHGPADEWSGRQFSDITELFSHGVVQGSA